ncbi:hypothetical protein PsW64_01796 [Pseudovibrio sp. W64]|uniref:DUF4132 domain-containing protein n=1 Tax=Pseudovibrio sp. W64 TaxID=1735583 RepID=UPI0007B29F60|nr:DUF4132 domain-containing protein [Pseudovibrio sp. W64]KZK84126.1 hypothetical protein PsW64_01796 [Pseudovibrio sp. W64]
MTTNSARAFVLSQLRQPEAQRDFGVLNSYVQALSPFDRGAILATMWEKGDFQQTAGTSISGILRDIEEGGLHETVYLFFTPEEAAIALSGLARTEIISGGSHEKDVCYRYVARILLGTIGTLPEEALKTLRKLHPRISKGSADVALIVAHAIGDDLLLDAALVNIAARNDGPISFEEFEAVAGVSDLRTLANAICEISPELSHSIPAHDSVLADISEWRLFAEHAVEEVLRRSRRIVAGTVKYQSDKLTSVAEASAVARAVKLALTERLDWGLKTLDELWVGAALAPDHKAKSMPSQSLSIQLGKVVRDEPQPEAVLIAQKITREIRHAGVKKKLQRTTKEAIRNLSLHPERVLDLLTTSHIPDEFTKLIKPALEGMLLRLWWLDVSVWARQMTDKSLWPMTSKLIWEVEDEGDRFAAVLKGGSNEGLWLLVDGSTRLRAEWQRVRLWHPVESSEEERQEWQFFVTKEGIKQPFPQAFREIYPVMENELGTNTSRMFAGHTVSQVPLFGLSQQMGWRPSDYETLAITLAGRRFNFETGIRTFPGCAGEGTTGNISLKGPEKKFSDVPQRVLSEAFRQTDLLVATGAAGVEDILLEDAWDKTKSYPGQQSVKMRKIMLQLTHPTAHVEGRWLMLADGYRINLSTGRIVYNGAPIELPKTDKRQRGTDRVMDKLWSAISVFGLAG